MKLKRIILATILAAGTLVGVANSASAASAPAPNVKACFSYASTGGPASGLHAELYEASPTATSWTPIHPGTTNSAGCVTWIGVHRGYGYHAMVHQVYGGGYDAYGRYLGIWVGDGYTNAATTGSTGTLSVAGLVTYVCRPGVAITC